MESACVLREGLMSFMYNISYTKQSFDHHRSISIITEVKIYFLLITSFFDSQITSCEILVNYANNSVARKCEHL